MAREGDTEVVLGLLAAPGVASELAKGLAMQLERELMDGSPSVRWRVQPCEDDLVQPPAEDAEIVAAARDLVLARCWDLAVCLTDLPLREARASVPIPNSSWAGRKQRAPPLRWGPASH